EPLDSFFSILGVTLTDEDHYLAPVRDCFFDQTAGLATCIDVTGSDIERSFARRRIAVSCLDQCLLGAAVDHCGLVCGIKRANSDSVSPFDQKIIKNSSLLSR